MTTPIPIDKPPLTLRLRPAIMLSEETFFAFCRQNDELRIERTADGAIEIMPPVGGGTSYRNATITHRLEEWSLENRSGVTFDSSCGYILPNGAVRSPDASWVLRSRLTQFSAAQIEQFLPLCPDFVIELRSPSDSLALTQEKLREYIANGARLGWLLDVPSRRAYVYRPEYPVAELDTPATLSGDPELPGFTLELSKVWNLDF